MHELSVAESLLDLALRHTPAQAKITVLHLVIGQLSTIVDDSVQFYWDMIAQGTAAEGATLHFRRIPAEMTCLDCGHRFPPGADTFACPQCASVKVKVSGGTEFLLEAIDVEEKTDDRRPMTDDRTPITDD